MRGRGEVGEVELAPPLVGTWPDGAVLAALTAAGLEGRVPSRPLEFQAVPLTKM